MRYKLTYEKALEIRTQRAAGRTLHQLAAAFGVSSTMTHSIVTGRSWNSPHPRKDWRDQQPRYEVDQETGCWNWIGTLRKGYGRIHLTKGRVAAHRWMYEKMRGAIPPGLEPDHTCENKRCINPDHIELVTHRVNCQRASRGRPRRDSRS